MFCLLLFLSRNHLQKGSVCVSLSSIKKNQCVWSETCWLKYINNVTKLQNRRNNRLVLSLFCFEINTLLSLNTKVHYIRKSWLAIKMKYLYLTPSSASHITILLDKSLIEVSYNEIINWYCSTIRIVYVNNCSDCNVKPDPSGYCRILREREG